jgi:predicted Zn-dependent protease
LLGAVPLLENDPLQRYVNQVGNWVALHTERKDLGWRFAILDSEDINAFAAPGGYIFITKGLLRRMNSESELAGALAHETVHVVEKHHLSAVQKAARMDLAVTLARTQVKDEDQDRLDKISAGFREIYSRGLDKQDEFEADRMGVVIATRAGYDPYGLPAVLQTLAGMNPNDRSLAFLFKTHPPAGKRLSLLERLFDRLDPYSSQPQLEQRFHDKLALLK